MRDARGSSSVEVVLLAPVLVVLMLLAVGCGRWVSAALATRNAVDQAARAATVVSAGRMERVALGHVERELSVDSSYCSRLSARVDLRRQGRVSFVVVNATCSVDLRGLLGILGTSRKVSARSTEVIDVFTFR